MTACENCEKEPKGVTMWPDMEGYSCPYCGEYNQLDSPEATE